MNYPSFRDFSFQLLIPNHFSTTGFVGFSIFIWKIKLHKPIFIEQLCHGFKVRRDGIIILDFCVYSFQYRDNSSLCIEIFWICNLYIPDVVIIQS